jgi:hypothetical protein
MSTPSGDSGRTTSWGRTVGTAPPAGWFTSPDDDLQQRWWDGTAWTSFTRPVDAPSGMPTQRTGSPLTTDAPGAVEPPHTVEETAEALSTLQRQGGILGVFAGMASQALASQVPPTTSPAAPGTNGPGVQPYGQAGLPDLFGGSSGGSTGSGPNVSWRVGSVRGGDDRYDGYGWRRRRNAGPVGTLLIGIVFLVAGSFFAVHMTSLNKVHAGESTATGSIVGHSTVVDNDGDTMCSPIASFTVGGETYEAGSNTSTNHCASEGSQVQVIYTTAAPGDGSAHIKDTGLMAWLIWLFPLVGLVVTALAVRSLVAMGRSIRALLPFGNR